VTTVGFGAEAVWENDATQLPVRRIAVPAAWPFADARSLAGLAIDNVFTGWSGRADVTNSSTGVRATLAADRACGFLVVYAPPRADFIALEPVTHETDAFNRSAAGANDVGFRTLGPGCSFSCTMRIAASGSD
jgi:aldose 1-epimerase